MNKDDWSFVKDMLDPLIFRLAEQDKKIHHLEQQLAELRKGVTQ